MALAVVAAVAATFAAVVEAVSPLESSLSINDPIECQSMSQ